MVNDKKVNCSPVINETTSFATCMNNLDEISLQQRFEETIAAEDKLEIKDFLNNQNISDVAELIAENEDYQAQIIAHLSIHRAASVFKILDLADQKQIVRELPPFKTAELLNELPADDRVDFLEELPHATVRDLIKICLLYTSRCVYEPGILL